MVRLTVHLDTTIAVYCGHRETTHIHSHKLAVVYDCYKALHIYFLAGKSLVYDLLHDFLFPASKLMMDSMNEENSDALLSEFNPK